MLSLDDITDVISKGASIINIAICKRVANLPYNVARFRHIEWSYTATGWNKAYPQVYALIKMLCLVFNHPYIFIRYDPIWDI